MATFFKNLWNQIRRILTASNVRKHLAWRITLASGNTIWNPGYVLPTLVYVLMVCFNEYIMSNPYYTYLWGRVSLILLVGGVPLLYTLYVCWKYSVRANILLVHSKKLIVVFDPKNDTQVYDNMNTVHVIYRKGHLTSPNQVAVTTKNKSDKATGDSPFNPLSFIFLE